MINAQGYIAVSCCLLPCSFCFTDSFIAQGLMSLKHRIDVGSQLSVSLKATLTLGKVEWSDLAQQSGVEDPACYVD